MKLILMYMNGDLWFTSALIPILLKFAPAPKMIDVQKSYISETGKILYII